MKRTILVTLVALLALLALPVAQAMAAPPHPGQNWGRNVNASACDGTLVINVSHDVTNDGDSGIGRYWAYDNYHREIQVWQTGTDTFCAVVRYQGQFTATAGSSPGGTGGTIPAGYQGTFEGGYTAIITGTLSTNLAYSTTDYIGSFDYGWDGDLGHGAHNPFSWPSAYFASLSGFDFVWWGWVYHGGACGTWYNTADGNDGDIAC